MIEIRILRFGVLALLTTAMYGFAAQDSKAPVGTEGASQGPSQAVHTAGQGDTNQPSVTVRNPRYRLRYGDSIELKFPITPEFDQTVAVQPDGYISLLQLDDLHVEGKTKSELIEALRKSYGRILHEPEIMARLLEFEKPYFVAGGEVKNPGKYDMNGGITVAQAVSIAGGITTSAKHSQIYLFRRVSDEWTQVTEVDIKSMFNKADLTEDLHLQPGDLVYVPKSRIAKIKDFLPKIPLVIRLPGM
jgi:polysaccharide export outer membrane protein